MVEQSTVTNILELFVLCVLVQLVDLEDVHAVVGVGRGVGRQDRRLNNLKKD